MLLNSPLRRRTQTRREMLQKSMAGVTAAFASLGLTPDPVRPPLRPRRNSRLWVALVGGQHVHTPDFANRLAANDALDVKYVWDSNPDTARRRRDIVGGEIVGDVSVIYDDPEVRAVIVCSQTVRHIQLVPPAVAAGKHVFVEKPLGMNGEEAVQLASAINEAGVLFQTGYLMRSEPQNIFVRSLIQGGTIGQVTRMRISIGHGGALHGWFDGEWRWMADPERAGVGGFGDLGAHAVDLLVWFTEGDRPVLCTGHVGTATARYPDVDEYGEGMVRFESGLIATIAAGWVDVANPNVLEVSGTEGHLRVTQNELFIRSDNLEGAEGVTPWTDLPPALPHPFDLFLDAVQGAEVPLVKADEAALGNRIVSAIYRGSRTNTWVKP